MQTPVNKTDNPDAGPNALALLRELSKYVEQAFDRLDLDGDGFLSKDELEEALLVEGLSPKEKGYLEFLKVRVDEITAKQRDILPGNFDGISRAELTSYFHGLGIKI
ncbi:MAG: hypothetical protein IPP97_06115 [Candidatus Obscuribacter sp.]|nr:hypothetical protein [Candidatus Obscuribacter sp.]MDQ5967009.1 EF-hand protein [Cyanobacteriota bacterium erpe_2018_sw_39hr_WHONDRS-SW48-000098_B_bin.30]MBL0185282.1 hypothetical protein [Candidatus Obscuribacter sp.]MBP6349068.1 hypothetical protein [Candidatus Obscuribacter sp.]MBP6592111.1 hypothetical protein [Candidatus Obscuribacter sp.]